VASAEKILLTQLLRQVSRSFYLTLRMLPQRIRPQICLAYLLARTADTIADTEIVPVAKRLAALAALRQRMLGDNRDKLDFGELVLHQGTSAERILLERCEDSLSMLMQLNAEDLRRVRQVLDTITSGQILDLERFSLGPTDGTPTVKALQTEAELDDYTWRVAGCVGEFWSRMCRAHLFPTAPLDETRWFADGVRFGKGLQLINILRDLPRDLRQGRCYVPMELLRPAGLFPADLLDPSVEPRFRPIYTVLRTRAENYLAAGWNYTNTFPGPQFRVRLGCAWPILIGVRTMARLDEENLLDPAMRIKVSRADIRGIILKSLWRAPFPALFGRLWVTKAGKAVDSRHILP
jgi:farnesyl-diphosphate farnesyltransferase